MNWLSQLLDPVPDDPFYQPRKPLCRNQKPNHPLSMTTTQSKPNWRRWFLMVIYAMAMAWVESAVVFYLRTMIGRIDPYQADPFPIVRGFGWVELAREFSTIVMLFAVGCLAGRTWRARIGYFVIGFGVWDIFYYVFLKVICGWPHSLLDWDVLFLLPMPWWGPVLAPMLISLLMMIWGTLASRESAVPAPRSQPAIRQTTRPALRGAVSALAFAGVVLALYVFMADTLAAVPHGLAAICSVLPQKFNWTLFGMAWLMMAAPLLQAGWQAWMRPRGLPAINGKVQNLDASAN